MPASAACFSVKLLSHSRNRGIRRRHEIESWELVREAWGSCMSLAREWVRAGHPVLIRHSSQEWSMVVVRVEERFSGV